MLIESMLAQQTPRGRPATIRGLINHRKLDDGAMEYKVLLSDQSVVWRKDEQLGSELVQQYHTKREERRKQRKKAEVNRAHAVVDKNRAVLM